MTFMPAWTPYELVNQFLNPEDWGVFPFQGNSFSFGDAVIRGAFWRKRQYKQRGKSLVVELAKSERDLDKSMENAERKWEDYLAYAKNEYVFGGPLRVQQLIDKNMSDIFDIAHDQSYQETKFISREQRWESVMMDISNPIAYFYSQSAKVFLPNQGDCTPNIGEAMAFIYDPKKMVSAIKVCQMAMEMVGANMPKDFGIVNAFGQILLPFENMGDIYRAAKAANEYVFNMLSFGDDTGAECADDYYPDYDDPRDWVVEARENEERQFIEDREEEALRECELDDLRLRELEESREVMNDPITPPFSMEGGADRHPDFREAAMEAKAAEAEDLLKRRGLHE